MGIKIFDESIYFASPKERRTSRRRAKGFRAIILFYGLSLRHLPNQWIRKTWSSLAPSMINKTPKSYESSSRLESPTPSPVRLRTVCKKSSLSDPHHPVTGIVPTVRTLFHEVLWERKMEQQGCSSTEVGTLELQGGEWNRKAKKKWPDWGTIPGPYPYLTGVNC